MGALHGLRHDWADLPQDVVSAVTEHTGPIERAVGVEAGYSSQLAATLDTADGRVFVKGMRLDHDGRWAQDVEAAVGPYLAPLAPDVLWRVVEGGWDLIGFEHIDGRGADYRPGSPDLARVVDGITAVGRIALPEGIRIKRARARWGRYLDYPADAVAFAGDAVAHSDLNPGNLLLTADHEVRMVDWPFATRGAAWLDAACWVVWLVHNGHTPHAAEHWAAKVPAWGEADPEAIDLFAIAQTRYWQATVDAHTNRTTMALRDAASRWAIHRGIWP